MLTSAVLALCDAGAVTAGTYTCRFTGRESGKSIPDYVIIQHDAADGSVTVNDPIIKKYLGGPLAGRLKSLNGARALFSWRLPAQKNANGNWIPGVTFSVNIIRASGKAAISSNHGGNYKATRASGACTLE